MGIPADGPFQIRPADCHKPAEGNYQSRAEAKKQATHKSKTSARPWVVYDKYGCRIDGEGSR